MHSNNQGSLIGRSIFDFSRENSKIFIFVLLAVFFFITSGEGANTIARDISIRFFRNLLLILSLIFPIMAGVGLNFGIVLGAMSAQIALIVIMILGFDKIGTGVAYFFWTVFTLGFSVISGYLLALLYNKTKKREMIAGLLVGFFANGIYMFILMVILGTIIKLSDPALVGKSGAPIKMTVDVPKNMYAAIDKALPVAYYYLCIAAYAVLMVFFVFTLVKNSKQKDKVVKRSTLIFTLIKMAVITVIFAFCMLNYTALVVLANTNMPLLTCIINAVVIFFIWRIMISKLGHDFIAARNDIAIADAAGINVDRVRMIAIVLSTAMAGLGQIILLQNLGSFIVYQTHVTIPAYAIAALLIGGATVKSASVKNAIIGNILFQAIYSSAPNAAKMLLGNPQIGEYFRTSLSYGVIAVAIVLYAANEARGAKQISEQAA